MRLTWSLILINEYSDTVFIDAIVTGIGYQINSYFVGSSYLLDYSLVVLFHASTRVIMTCATAK